MSAAAKIDNHYDDSLGPWYIDIPHGEADGGEPAHVHVINQQTSFRGKIWIGVDDSVPKGSPQRYHFVFERNTAEALNNATRTKLLETLQNIFKSDEKGIIDFFEHTWRGDWYRDS